MSGFRPTASGPTGSGPLSGQSFQAAWASAANAVWCEGAQPMKKNVASQKIGIQMVSATDGSAFTGSVTVYVTGDAGTQAAGSVGSGACTHEGNGYHTYAPAQAETNFDLIAFTFVGAGAVPSTIQVFTTFPQTGDSFARVGAPAGASIAADLAAIQADTDNLQSRIPAALVGGRMDASVGAMATDTVTAAALAADAVTEIQSGLATAAALSTVAGYVDTEVAAIKAKTDNLPSDPADASDIASAFGTVNSTLATIAGYIDTEVAAIKAKTDNLPASPAAVGDIPTAQQNADALLDRDMAAGADNGSPTVRTVRQALRFLRNKWSISGTTLTVTKEDDATASWTSTVATSAGADPVVGNDPA